MAINAVSGSAASNLQATNLNMEDFIKILLTQLTYQDPLKPMDNQEFMAQMAQFTTLEQTRQLNDKIETLISNQSALQSVGLIGKTADISTSAGNISGTVVAISLSGDSPTISLKKPDGTILTNISLGQLVAVR
ncbi:flagellar hook assembly protein FlgD [Acidovorax facilis]|uniref:flagellar hook assembly protein FlgD n=1 Tax=Acidovorax facilis TaxID=12917 RepID=UPI003CE864D6